MKPPPDDVIEAFKQTCDQYDKLERLAYVEALRRCGGLELRAAELLGLPRSTVKRRIKELGLLGELKKARKALGYSGQGKPPA